MFTSSVEKISDGVVDAIELGPGVDDAQTQTSRRPNAFSASSMSANVLCSVGSRCG